jgi:hypothetical protein
MPGTNKEPPPPPAAAVPVDDSDIINVVIGADEERAQVEKRRRQHAPPDEEGVPQGADAAHELIATIEDEQGDAGGDGRVAEDLAAADTVRYGEGEDDLRLTKLRRRARARR